MKIHIFLVGNTEVIATIKFKKHVIGIYIFCVFVGKFSYWKMLSLIILLGIDKSPKVGFYYIILLLHLAINLRLESNKELLLDF